MKGSCMVVSERLILFTRFKVGGSGACNYFHFNWNPNFSNYQVNKKLPLVIRRLNKSRV